MKGKLVRSILTVIVVLAMLLTYGCGSATKDTSETTQGASQGTTASTTPAQTEAAADPFEKYDPPITIDMVHQLHVPAATFYPEGDSVDNNVWTRTIEEELGIKLKYRWADVNTTEKVNLMIASGDLPDIFMVDRNQFEQLANGGKLEDLTEAYEKYASPAIKKNDASDNYRILEYVKKNGRMLGFPWYSNYYQTQNTIWIRADWLKNLNMPVPQTAEELFKVAEAFTEKDPDGNGKADTYGIFMHSNGIGASSSGTGGAYWNMFHSYPDIWIKNSSGELVHGMFGSPEQIEATRNGLLKLQELYAKGHVNRDFGVMDVMKAYEEVINGKCGIMFGGTWDTYAPSQNILKDPNADWIPIPVMSIDDKPAKVSSEYATIVGIYVVRKGFKYPEALIKLANIYFKYAMDPETSNVDKYSMDPETKSLIFYMHPVQSWWAMLNSDRFHKISEAIATGSTANMPKDYMQFYNDSVGYVKDGNRNQWGNYIAYGHKDGSLALLERYIDNGMVIFNEFMGIPTTAMIQKQPVIDKMWLETMTQVVMGADISKYDEFIRNYKTLGGDEIAKEVNDWYKSKN